MRFFSQASVVGADQTVPRFAPMRANAVGSNACAGEVASCAEILLSTSATRISAWLPARVERAGNESVDGISCVILPEGTVGGIARRFEITAESLSHLIPSLTGLFGRSHRSSDSTGSYNTENCPFNRVVDAQASKCDAAWFSSVQPAAPSAVAWDMMLRAGIAERQLASAVATANQSGEQGVTMLARPRCRLVETLLFETIVRIASNLSQLT
jgi:hypothetical protein